VAKADPDGHTILLTASSHTISPWAYSNLPYDTVGDLAGITPLANLPNVLVVAPAANIRSAQALVAAARSRPGGLNYASGGSGSATHLNAERFRLSAGFDGLHVLLFGGGKTGGRKHEGGQADGRRCIPEFHRRSLYPRLGASMLMNSQADG
jgi:tripartite-type tricarboxylate transporter receptor subunit TctC